MIVLENTKNGFKTAIEMCAVSMFVEENDWIEGFL